MMITTRVQALLSGTKLAAAFALLSLTIAAQIGAVGLGRPTLRAGSKSVQPTGLSNPHQNTIGVGLQPGESIGKIEAGHGLQVVASLPHADWVNKLAVLRGESRLRLAEPSRHQQRTGREDLYVDFGGHF